MDSLKAYEGREPYVFISYAHANAPAVTEIMRDMGAHGYRLWYDGGIEVGSEWPEYIASHLAGAELMLAFISKAYLRSDNCRKELHFALSRRIPVVSVFLEDTALTPGVEMQLGNVFALMKYTMDEDAFYSRLYTAPPLDPGRLTDGSPSPQPRTRKRRAVPVDLTAEAKRQKKKRVRRWIRLGLLGLLLIAALVLGLIGHFTGWNERLLLSREQTAIVALPDSAEAVFQSPLLEQAARAYSGVNSGPLHVADLAGLRELYVYGDRALLNEPDEAQRAAALSGGGTVDTLSDLRFFPDLRTLHLIGQPLGSLDTLPVCGLEYLDLSGCRLSSLAGISRLPRLRELRADGCPLRELGDLAACLQLRLISLLDTNITDVTSLKPLTELAEFRISHSSTGDLHTVFQLSSLTSVTLDECDLRGAFFKAFDRERSLVRLTLIDCKLDSTDNLEDFRGLTTLTLIRTGAELDWTGLAALPSLQTVYADETLLPQLAEVLAGTEIRLLPAEDAAAS